MGNFIKMKKILPIKDDILTLSLPKSDIILTRYLYLKDEVELALLLSILNKNESESLFWAYELYYSGFYKTLFDFIWKIYYDFFATLNPSFESYLFKKQNEYYDLNRDDKIIASIVKNLISREFNTDVFILRIVSNLFESDDLLYIKNINRNSLPDVKMQFAHWITIKEYRHLCTFILESKGDIDFVAYYSILFDLLYVSNSDIKEKAKYMRNFIKSYDTNINPKILLVSRFLQMVSYDNIKKNNSFLLVDDAIIEEYKNINSNLYKPYKILNDICLYGINEVKMLNLFKINRTKYNAIELTNMFHDRWLYHASFSPLWHKRIRDKYGYINYVKMDVKFKSDYYLEEFYDYYGYEPDEQTSEIQNKHIGPIDTTENWFAFYKKYKNNGLISIDTDELEELGVEPVCY